jgi:hypothetical protein
MSLGKVNLRLMFYLVSLATSLGKVNLKLMFYLVSLATSLGKVILKLMFYLVSLATSLGKVILLVSIVMSVLTIFVSDNLHYVTLILISFIVHFILITVQPVLRGHLWDKEKVAL